MDAMKASVDLGDRYIKLDAPNIFWIVSDILNVADPVPHVRLVHDGTSGRQITLSVAALQDTSLHKKIEAKL